MGNIDWAIIARWIACALAGLGMSIPAMATQIEILVPAYFYPSGAGLDAWRKLAQAAHKTPLVVIANPDSGPGAAIDTDYEAVIDEVRAAGARVIGYVYTSYGARPIADVVADIERYRQFYAIDGFFLDEAANAPTTELVAYYAQVFQYIKALHPDYRVITNPGTTTAEVFMSHPTADTIVTFESDSAAYRNYRPSAWVGHYGPDRFAHLVYATSTYTAAVGNLNRALQRNASVVYVTSEKLVPNPWDALPAYWTRFVSEVCRRNGGANC